MSTGGLLDREYGEEKENVLHDAYDSRFDIERATIVIFLLCLMPLAITLDFVALRYNTNFELHELALEAFVETKFICQLHILTHRRLCKYTGFWGNG